MYGKDIAALVPKNSTAVRNPLTPSASSALPVVRSSSGDYDEDYDTKNGLDAMWGSEVDDDSTVASSRGGSLSKAKLQREVDDFFFSEDGTTWASIFFFLTVVNLPFFFFER